MNHKVYICEECEEPCTIIVSGNTILIPTWSCPLNANLTADWNKENTPADNKALQELTYTEFYGECGGCHMCAYLETAIKEHHCKRGQSMNYTQCGTTNKEVLK